MPVTNSDAVNTPVTQHLPLDQYMSPAILCGFIERVQCFSPLLSEFFAGS
jgi:hypothetical protein